MLEGNLEPMQYHVHTIMRMPNGGDYGYALLGAHHETQRADLAGA
jgi:hypothetical protein